MQISRYASTLILGGTHVWVRDTQRKIQGCLCGWHLQITNTHNYVHTCSGEGRLIMQYKDSHEVKMILL